jgi:hypothetical protein
VSALEGTVAFSALPNGEALRQRLAEPITTLEEDIAIVSDNALSKESQMQAHHQDAHWLLTTLNALNWKDCAALFLHSWFEGSGSLFKKITPSGFFEGRKFYHNEFKECLRLRLMLPLIPLASDSQTDSYTCPCSAVVNLLESRFHCLGCTEHQNIFNTRHMVVVKILHDAMVNDRAPHIQPLSSPHSTSPEVTLPTPTAEQDEINELLPRRDDNSAKRADLGFINGIEQIHFLVDVGIMAPTAPSYLKHKTNTTPNAAHHIIDQQKFTRYRSLIEPTTPLPATYHLIPFIIDCTGNFGQYTPYFFDRQDMQGKRRNGAVRQVRAAIDAFNAKLCSTHRRFCIPIVTPSKNSRIQPLAEGEQPRRRGRPRGSRSRGRAQVAAVIVHNSSPNVTDMLPVNDHQEADFFIPTALGEE